MVRETHRYFKFDWITIILFLLLVIFGWVNILSASHGGHTIDYFNFDTPYSKQLFFIGFTVLLVILILAVDAKFYERFSSIIYLISIASLIGLFLFGKTVNSATSWYAIGSMTIQPSEFAKTATALAVAKYLSDLNTNIKNLKDQLRLLLIIGIPAVLVLLQNDAGSSLVYLSFFFVLHSVGLPKYYFIIFMLVFLLAIITLKFGVITAIVLAAIGILLLYFFKKKKPSILLPFGIIFFCALMAFGIRFFYSSTLQPHQQERINLWLRLENDPEKIQDMRRNVLYNLYESEKAIRSGGLTGKGFLEGTRTKGQFVPEQHTDYIFSTVGEEWGFMGSAAVVLVFTLLILRIIYLAEAQKNQFSKAYGYGVASILFFHFMINIGMVMGLIPTIGIPLPFFSYGGSGLWGFTILLFIFIKLDSNKINEW